MISNVILVSYMRLDELPPALELIHCLTEMGSTVHYVSAFDDSEKYSCIFGDKVKFYHLINDTRMIPPSSFYQRCINFIKRKRYENRMKKAFSLLINDLYQKLENSCLWVLHSYTVEYLKKELLKTKIPYIFTLYELDERIINKKKNLSAIYTNAQQVVVPGYTRAHIVKAWAKLPYLPSVLPNKSTDMESSDNIKSEIIDRLKLYKTKGKKIVLYSGIFLRERLLDYLCQAVRENKDKYALVFMGRKSEYLEELLLNYSDVIDYIGFFNPPDHLDYVKYADFGVIVYDAHDLNTAFCAPNKIWEYSKFGIPIIANDIPGLRFSVEYNKIGKCCDFENKVDISKTLDYLSERGQEMKENAINFYESVDIKEIVLNIIEKYEKDIRINYGSK